MDQTEKLIIDIIDQHRDEIIEFARDIYTHAELGYKEFRTSQKFVNKMKELGLHTETGFAITGVKAYLNEEKKENASLALLGELDALRIPEHAYVNPETDAAHCCGHHAQMAGIFGAALALTVPEIAEKLGGQVVFFATPAEVFTTLPFTDREIISLFGNLLDNAIEACERITDKNTWIHIKMKKKNQLLYFEIKNTTETTVQQVPGKFITTKTDGTLHGYGIKNIMDVVEKYHGIFQSQMVEDYFVVMISVYADICID